MTAMEKALEKINISEMTDWEDVGTNMIYIPRVEVILQEFEIDLLNEIDEQKLKQEYANR